MIVVSDASPINYLSLIGQADLLHGLFDVVIIPRTVRQELLSTGAPEADVSWMSDLPGWVRVESSTPILNEALDDGEKEAIALAVATNALLLVDDKPARRAAVALGVPILGTLGVLEAASKRGFVDLLPAIYHLLDTSIRLSTFLVEEVRERERVRRAN